MQKKTTGKSLQRNPRKIKIALKTKTKGPKKQEAKALEWLREQRNLFLKGQKQPRKVCLEEAKELSKKGTKRRKFIELKALIKLFNEEPYGVPFEIPPAGRNSPGIISFVSKLKLQRERIASIAIELNQTLAITKTKGSGNLLHIIEPKRLDYLAPSGPTITTGRPYPVMVLYSPLDLHRIVGLLPREKTRLKKELSPYETVRICYKSSPQMFTTKITLNELGNALKQSGRLTEINPEAIISKRR